MAQPRTARIVEWNHERGFGYLETGGKRLFLHIRDFTKQARAPRKGDRVTFIAGMDAKGRPCAKEAEHLHSRCRVTACNGLALVFLLGLPGLALCKLPLDTQIAAAYAVLASLLTYAVYATDKKRALSGAWRISESSLHLLELIGGWPGAFLAQKSLRHKTSKSDFLAVFWAIVCLYQLVSFDFLLDWRISRMVWESIHWTTG